MFLADRGCAAGWVDQKDAVDIWYTLVYGLCLFYGCADVEYVHVCCLRQRQMCVRDGCVRADGVCVRTVCACGRCVRADGVCVRTVCCLVYCSPRPGEQRGAGMPSAA